jgi:hypothetical protein
MANRQISEGRKTTYYVGMILIIVGLLTFCSNFVYIAMGMSSAHYFFGNGSFEVSDPGDSAVAFVLRALGGMAMFVLGGVLMGIGRAGLAGSGVVLDPEQAREDVEPWARAAGGVFKDALDESGLQLGAGEKKEEADQALPFDEKLRKLHKLLEEGLVSQEEYEKEKQKILDQA